MLPDDSSDDPYVQVTLELRQSTLVWLDDLRKEWGLHSRGDLVSRLLDELAKPTSNALDLLIGAEGLVSAGAAQAQQAAIPAAPSRRAVTAAHWAGSAPAPAPTG